MGLGLATKAFFSILFNGEAAASYRAMLDGKNLPAPESNDKAPEPTEPASKKPQRSDAISLLAALQRESRLLDIVQESLDDYTDEQVGGAARDVLRDAGKVIDRIFAIRPLTEAEEGSELETPKDVDPGRYRLTGNVSGEGPFRGSVAHHGWEASQCEIPSWSGSEASANVIAPLELEIS